MPYIPLYVSTLHMTSYASTQSYDSTYDDIFRASLSPAQENIVHFKIRFKHTLESKHPPLYFFRVRVRVTVQSSTLPQSLEINPRYYTSLFLFLFLHYLQVLSHSQRRGVLDNPHSLQLLHSNEDGVVLGTNIQDSQCDITLR